MHISEHEPISVVIVNHNAGLLLTECILTALKQAQQIIVVDNASSDSSLSAVNAKFPEENRLQIIRLNRNIGFAAGCNMGLAASNQPYILFLNPDCILGNYSLQRMIQVIESDLKIGMVGGYLINPDGSEQGGGRRAIPTPWQAFVRAFSLFHLQKYWPQLFSDFHLHNQPLPKAPMEVEAISGALMLVRRKAIDDVGEWDEHYFLHCEDLDWCMRFKRQNWKIVFVPDAPVTHFQGTCSRSRPLFIAWHKHKGMLRFYRKFFRHQYPRVLMGLITIGIWFHFGIAIVSYIGRNSYRVLKTRHG